MSEWRQIALASGSVLTGVDAASIASLKNMCAMPNAPGSQYPFTLRRLSGLRKGPTLATAGPRASCLVRDPGGDEILYVATATKVYAVQVSDSMDAWLVTELGSITYGSNSVSAQMAFNGTHVVTVTGDGSTIWYSRLTGTVHATVALTYMNSITFQDGYLIAAQGEDDGISVASRKFYISAPDDATSWGAADYSENDQVPDTIRAVISSGGLLYVIGKVHTEVWQNTGNSAFPFERINGMMTEIGTPASRTVAQYDGAVYMVGQDKKVYRIRGGESQVISTPWVEDVLFGSDYAIHPYAFGEIVFDRGGAYYRIDPQYVYTLSQRSTLLYSIKDGVWIERQSPGLGLWRARQFQQRLSVDDKQSSGLALDYTTGATYLVDAGVTTEGGAYTGAAGASDVTAEIITPPVAAGGKSIFFDEFLLEVETGISSVTETGANYPPEVSLEWTDDDGNTWSNPVYRPVGFSGEYNQRVSWHGLGRSPRRRSFRIRYSHASQFNVLGAQARISVGA